MLRQWNTKTSVSQSGMWVAKIKSDLFGDTTSRIHRVCASGVSVDLNEMTTSFHLQSPLRDERNILGILLISMA